MDLSDEIRAEAQRQSEDEKWKSSRAGNARNITSNIGRPASNGEGKRSMTLAEPQRSQD